MVLIQHMYTRRSYTCPWEVIAYVYKKKGLHDMQRLPVYWKGTGPFTVYQHDVQEKRRYLHWRAMKKATKTMSLTRCRSTVYMSTRSYCTRLFVHKMLTYLCAKRDSGIMYTQERLEAIVRDFISTRTIIVDWYDDTCTRATKIMSTRSSYSYTCPWEVIVHFCETQARLLQLVHEKHSQRPRRWEAFVHLYKTRKDRYELCIAKTLLQVHKRSIYVVKTQYWNVSREMMENNKNWSSASPPRRKAFTSCKV